MSLREINLKTAYRSDSGSLVDEFYLPCLTNSTNYWRAVGYFTGQSLAVAAKGLPALMECEGSMRLIASPNLSAEDLESIEAGYKARERYQSVVLQALERVGDGTIKKRLGFLGWLIARGALDIKLATRSDYMPGIYHEKVGLFFDDEENVVAFTGSSNETTGGWYSNFESIDVFRSWIRSERERVESKVENFRRLWKDETPGLKIIAFPEAAQKVLEQYAPSVRPTRDPESQGLVFSRAKPHPAIPSSITLRDYQEEAISRWQEAGGKGVFSMATGTGKTITAITATVRLLEQLGSMVLVVVAPYKHLAEQWVTELEKFGFESIVRGYESKKNWIVPLNAAISAYILGVRNVVTLVTTSTTFSSEDMTQILAKVPDNGLLVADEMHHLGSPLSRKALPDHFPYRLGLSATPTRWFDEEGTAQLLAYFGNVVFDLPLKDAIGRFLTPYYYYPHLVPLTDTEREEYMQLSEKIARIWVMTNGEEGNASSALENLLFKRARLIGAASEKISVLKDTVEKEIYSTHNIFYCGDGVSPDQDERQIDIVLRILGQTYRMKVHPFTAEEDLKTRARILKEFDDGVLQGLVAIRCLDEGVDVPSTRTAYILASSRNPREFIQRRGRILRLYPNKDKATIHDFIVVPTFPDEIQYLPDRVFETERRMLQGELARVSEFANSALNGPEAQQVLLPVKKAYNLLAE